jgi:hypothetical protein
MWLGAGGDAEGGVGSSMHQSYREQILVHAGFVDGLSG